MPEFTRILDVTVVATFDDFAGGSGGQALNAARHRTPESIIDLIERSGLRGRGGAGFPTGRKWRTVAGRAPSGTPVIINAAEGEPGTFKDRALLRTNPFQVLEGACIAALAMQSDSILFVIKAGYTNEIARFKTAIDGFTEAGWLDNVAVRIIEGPSEYLFGEDTALLEVVDGRQPFPRVAPSYRRGIRSDIPAHCREDGPAALVDNVETLANVPGILRHGVDWFRSLGTSQSPGTLLCTVTGATRRHGVAEFTLGTPIREVLETIGQGVRNDRPIAAVLCGVSNPALGPDRLDTPLSYEHMAGIGGGLGSGTFIVINDETSLSSVAAGVARFLSIESCGQCEPCKRDGLVIASELVSGGHLRVVDDRLRTVATGARCALAGQIERVVGSLLALDRSGDIVDPGSVSDQSPYSIVPLLDIVDGRAVLDDSHLCKRADWSYQGDVHDSHAWPAQLHRALATDEPRAAEPPLPSEARLPEPARPTGRHDPFHSVHEANRQMEESLSHLRSAPPADRSDALASLTLQLERQKKAMEAIVYPAVSRLRPGVGDDIAWYPAHHEQHAHRLLEHLELGDTPISPRLVDELCADVHASIIEIDRRVLPVLEMAVADDPAEQDLLADAIDDFMTTE